MVRLRTSLLALLLSPSIALANGSSLTDNFDGGLNAAGWTYGPPPAFPGSDGNPGAYLRSVVDTFAPQVRTTNASTMFTGDYRAANATHIGVDLITHSTQFPAMREATLMLSSGSCSIVFLGTEFVPQPGTGWKSIDFTFDPHSPTAPPGWFAFGSCTDADVAWNTVMPNVTEVRIFYGNPTFFYIFDIWDVGFDNARVHCDGVPFYDLGTGLAGTAGVPELSATGTLAGGSPLTLSLTGAAPSSTAFLVTGSATLNLSTLGGVLVPDPGSGFVVPLPTGPAGTLQFTGTWPLGLPAGFPIYMQYWIVDGGGPSGFAASNAVCGMTP